MHLKNVLKKGLNVFMVRSLHKSFQRYTQSTATPAPPPIKSASLEYLSTEGDLETGLESHSRVCVKENVFLNSQLGLSGLFLIVATPGTVNDWFYLRRKGLKCHKNSRNVNIYSEREPVKFIFQGGWYKNARTTSAYFRECISKKPQRWCFVFLCNI